MEKSPSNNPEKDMITLVYSSRDPFEIDEAIRELAALKGHGYTYASFELDHDLELIKVYPERSRGDNRE